MCDIEPTATQGKAGTILKTESVQKFQIVEKISEEKVTALD